MATPLYRSASQPLTTLFGSIDGMAKAGLPVFPGSPGSVSIRRNQTGSAYYVRRYYDGSGSQRETYVGLVGEADARAAALKAQIEEVKAIQKEVRLLMREGFQSADAPSYATLASLHLHGLFVAGATLVGSHAFGILLNQMGVQAAAYATEDIDVARRREALAFEQLPATSFLDMLRDSGIHFVEVPQLDVRQPSTSFKQQGKSRFHVDLLVPSVNDDIGLAPVPELQAHATTLPYLAYLLGQTQMATLIASEGVCPVRLPVAERFAIHKMMVSQLRTNREAKSDKDLYQAAVLVAALGDHYPGAIETAVEDAPVSARKYLKRALPLVLAQLAAHPRAAEELAGVVQA